MMHRPLSRFQPSSPAGRLLPVLSALCLALLLAPSSQARQAQQPPPVSPAPAPVKPPEPTPEVASLLQQGMDAAKQRKNDEALKLFQTALERARLLSDKAGEGNALRRLAGVYRNAGQPQKALEFLQQALTLFQQIGDRGSEGLVLNSIGNVYRNTNQPQKALDFYQQALTIFQQVGDKAGKGFALGNMGYVYRNAGQPQKALEFLQQSLTISQQIGDKADEGLALYNIGNVYADTGQHQKALEFLQQALTLLRQVGDVANERNLLLNRGEIYRRAGQYPQALESLNEALPLLQKAQDRVGEARVLNIIGSVHRDMGQPQKALTFFQQALPLFQQNGAAAGITTYRVDEGAVLANIAAVHRDMGQHQKELELYQQALSLYRQVGYKIHEAQALHSIARAYSAMGQPQKALESYRLGILLVENIRTQVGSNQSGDNTEARTAYLQENIVFYYRPLALLLTLNTPAANEEAFQLAQKVKARTLLDRLGSARTYFNGKLTPQEREKEVFLRAECDRLNRLMLAEGVKNEVGSKKRFDDFKAALTKAEQTLSVYQDNLYARYPDLAVRRAARTDTLADTARALPENTALLEFVSLKSEEKNDKDRLDRTVLFVVTQGRGKPRLQVYNLGLTSETLAVQTRRLHNACARPTGDYKDISRTLYRSLLEKAAPQIAGKRALIVCPDASLWQMPFAALTDSQGRFLLEKHNLTLAYSATGWRVAGTVRAKQRTLQGNTRAGTTLVLADPEFGTAAQLAASRFGNTPGVAGQRPVNIPDRPVNVPDRPVNVPNRPVNVPDRPINVPDRPINMPDRGLALILPAGVERANAMRALPGTRAEANAIAKDFPNTRLLLGKQAQEETFKRLVAQYRFVHLATHGFFNDASPLLSSLVLAAPPASGAGSKEDGLLTARELLTLDLSRCELVVLSACNTGVGAQQSGEGIVGLTWCLVAAGCPSQVVSGWPVSDAATARLMAGFYRNLKQGKDKAVALRSSALSLHKARATTHPYYWAPFFLVGQAK